MFRPVVLFLSCLIYLPAAFSGTNDSSNSAALQTLEDNGSTISDIKKYRDLDQDGVPDNEDFCANTAKGTKVDKHGCELDSDGDGIYDKTDQCPNTPKGVSVNFLGCEGDEDKDGVLDSKDKCPSTPLNTKVNAFGCKIDEDSDGDGVLNSIDQCPNTPKGSIVNKYGCRPQTKISIQITFPVGSANIPSDQKAQLETEASKLKQLQPDEVVLITGYTDSSGKAETNERLSWQRANSVKDYILSNFDYTKEQFYILGRGALDPIASNKTKEGRKENRRINFDILNIKKLPKEASRSLPADMRAKK